MRFQARSVILAANFGLAAFRRVVALRQVCGVRARASTVDNQNGFQGDTIYTYLVDRIAMHMHRDEAVSYTHLTLPTICSV